MKKTTLKREDRKNEYEKDDDSLLQKNVCLIMMTVSSIVVEYAFHEDNQLYMLSSIYLLNIRRFYIFFTHSLMLDSSTVKRERKMSSVSSCRRDEEF